MAWKYRQNREHYVYSYYSLQVLKGFNLEVIENKYILLKYKYNDDIGPVTENIYLFTCDLRDECTFGCSSESKIFLKLNIFFGNQKEKPLSVTTPRHWYEIRNGSEIQLIDPFDGPENPLDSRIYNYKDIRRKN